MDATELDGKAQDVRGANEIAVEKSMKCIGAIKEIPVTHRNWINSQYNSSPLAHSLYRSHDSTRAGPIVVEIKTHFDGMWQNGKRYTIDCMLNVDVPQPDSDQGPHLGWEVKFDGQRIGIGHIWVPEGVIRLGRPRPGTELARYEPEFGQKNDFPRDGGGGSVAWKGSMWRYVAY